MNGRKILYAVVGTVFALSLGLLVARKIRTGFFTSRPTPEPKYVPGPASEKTKRVYQASRTPVLPRRDDHVSSSCAEYLSSLRGVDLTGLKIYPHRTSPFPKSDACKDLPKGLDEMDKKYQEACAPLMKPQEELTQKMWFEGLPLCEKAIFALRAAMTHFLTRTVPIQDLEDPKILLDKMVATMTDGNYAVNSTVAGRLLEIDPGFVAAMESLVISRFRLAEAEAKGNPNDKKWEELDRSLQKLIEIGALDTKQVLEWQLLIALSKNPDPVESKKYAERMTSQYPEWALPVYYQAWATYLAKDAFHARELLETARKKDASDLRFKEALEKIYKKDPMPFRSELTLKFPEGVF